MKLAYFVLPMLFSALLLSSCGKNEAENKYEFQKNNKTKIIENRFGEYSTADNAVDITVEYSVENKKVSLDMIYKNNTKCDISIKCGSPITVSINGGSSDKTVSNESKWVELPSKAKHEDHYSIDLSEWEKSGSNKWQTFSYNAVSLGFDIGFSLKNDEEEYTYSGEDHECCFVLNADGNESADGSDYCKFFIDFLNDISYSSIGCTGNDITITLSSDDERGKLTEFLEKWHINRDNIVIGVGEARVS